MFIREKKTKYATVLQLVRGERRHDGRVTQHIILSIGGLRIHDSLRKTVTNEV